MQAVIFDIDGTLADCEHRLHHLPNWGKFFGAMHLDPVIEPIAALANIIYNTEDYVVLIVTARPNSYEDQTREWLRKNYICYSQLYMRKTSDYREDSIVKAEILQQIIDDGYKPFLVVDDRPQVVKMWRDYGLTCLQCAPEEISLKHDGQHFLDILVGPAGAGKSEYATKYYPKHEIISTDSIRTELFGSHTNPAAHTPEGLEKTWRYAHGLLRTRLECHLRTCFDATNLKIKDRAKLLRQVPVGQYIRYIVIDRAYDAKMKTRGWRPEELVHKHHRTFQAELKNILAGDNQPNVVVVDKR
jgi:predicted kinase